MKSTSFDLVVFGATSFVGQILCRYLLKQFGVGDELRWAAAGRSQEKLEQLRQSLGRRAAKLPLLVADAADEASLRELCARTRVIVSTVGPYALYGEPLIKVCASTGTDYCDLTGEVHWIRRMIKRYEDTARKSGARIVHCCGFDSIPSDLGVFFLQREAMRRFGRPCERVTMRVRAMRGGVSGGTAATMMTFVKEAAGNPGLRKEIANPYSLCPDDYRPAARQPSISGPRFDPDFNAWIAPFVMSAVNTRIVQRSNALLEQAYGRDFTYGEAVLAGKGIKGRLAAAGIAAGLGGFMLAAAIPPSRWALEKFVLPGVGEGPSPETQRQGFFDMRFLGRTAGGQELRVKVTGDRDPGYGSSAKMLGQAAACLALDVTKSGRPGGFWTPAALFGERLIERLQAHSGLSFEVL
jgi:short subunit dehydrogenase-like uncharacterized protein